MSGSRSPCYTHDEYSIINMFKWQRAGVINQTDIQHWFLIAEFEGQVSVISAGEAGVCVRGWLSPVEGLLQQTVCGGNAQQSSTNHCLSGLKSRNANETNTHFASRENPRRLFDFSDFPPSHSGSTSQPCASFNSREWSMQRRRVQATIRQTELNLCRQRRWRFSVHSSECLLRCYGSSEGRNFLYFCSFSDMWLESRSVRFLIVLLSYVLLQVTVG